MSRSGLSILVFGFYLVLLGGMLLVVPNPLLAVAGLPPTDEAWIRLAGMLLLILSFYYIQAARTETRAFFQWTLYTRLGAILFLVALVTTGLTKPVVYLFWLGDLAGATWTSLALRAEHNDS